MTPRIIEIPSSRVMGILGLYDCYLIATENGGGKLEEYLFWKHVADVIPEVAEGVWVLDTTRPLRPVFIELKGNQK